MVLLKGGCLLLIRYYAEHKSQIKGSFGKIFRFFLVISRRQILNIINTVNCTKRQYRPQAEYPHDG